MRPASRALFVTIVTSVLVLTGCAGEDAPVLLDDGVAAGVEDGDDVDLGDADLLDDDVDDIERGVLVYDDLDGVHEVVHVAEAVDQCREAREGDGDDRRERLRVDLTDGGSLLVVHDADADDLVDVQLITEPDRPVITWEAAGEGAWELRDDVLLAEVLVDGPDEDGEADHVLRLAVDWHTDTPECLDADEPVTELEGGSAHLELPGARLDAVSVCEEELDDGIRYVVRLEEGAILTVTAREGDALEADLELAAGDVGTVDVREPTTVAAADGDLDGVIAFAHPESSESVEATFHIDREAALGCEG